MAYGTKYRSILYPPKTAHPVYVDILKNNYSGAITNLVIAKEGVVLTVEDTDYFDPIISTSVEISIINTLTDFFESLHDWDDLFAVNDFEVLIKVYDADYTYFEGFIPCDITEQKFYPKGVVTVNATVNLKRLTDFNPTLFTTRGQYVLIDIIKHCLAKTGLVLPIYVNCSLFAFTSYLGDIGASVYTPTYNYNTVARTVFDWVSVESDLFMKNDVEYENCHYVLENILTTFNCKLYYWNHAWYIERVKDLKHSPKHYVVYQTNNTITTSNETLSILEIGNSRTKLTHTGLSQRMQYNPGVKIITVNLKEKLRVNLTNYFYNAVVDVARLVFHYTVENYTALEHIWSYIRYVDAHAADPVSNYYGINYGVTTRHPSALSDINGLVNNISDINGWRNLLDGLYTKVKFSMNTVNETTLTLKFKFRLSDTTITNHAAEIQANPTRKFFVNIVLKNGTKYVKYDSTTSKYILVTRSNTSSSNILTANGTVLDPCIISQSISYESFTNKANYETDITMSIPINDFESSLVDTYFMVGVCRLKGYMNQYGGSEEYNVYFNEMAVGDVEISINEDLAPNVITGSVNSNFVTSKSMDMLIYDANPYASLKANILNQLYGVLPYGWLDAFYTPAPWVYTDALPIQNKVIEDQYKIYEVIRHTMVSDFYYQLRVKPCRLVKSWYYQNLFYVSGYRWVVDSNMYQSTSLKEIDADREDYT
jgi:hypothetical protein